MASTVPVATRLRRRVAGAHRRSGSSGAPAQGPLLAPTGAPGCRGDIERSPSCVRAEATGSGTERASSGVPRSCDSRSGTLRHAAATPRVGCQRGSRVRVDPGRLGRRSRWAFASAPRTWRYLVSLAMRSRRGRRGRRRVAASTYRNRAAADGSCSSSPAALLGAERDQRIDFRSAAGGDVARKESDGSEQRHCQ
jgi:hypothetical protein